METTVAYTVAPAYVTAPVILGLDCSSTTIGWCVLDGPTVRDYGELQLRHSDIAERCRLAYAGIGLVLANHPDVDAVAIESPVARFAKAVIPQARVSGAVMALCALRGLLVCEVTPGQAKRALAWHGDADKARMQLSARVYGVAGEHAADALGVALFGLGRVEVVRG